VAAKVHELLINASIAVMVHSYVVHELLGKGIPFGAMVAGKSFSEIAYLWDPDFLGAVFSRRTPWPQKGSLVLVVVAAVVLAALAAPSSAVAMIPRNLDVNKSRSSKLNDSYLS
jgi:hypothetical protein